jgi:Cu2+-exporting ATPase
MINPSLSFFSSAMNGYNILAIPLAACALYKFGIVLSPAFGAILMSLSTVIVAINARLLKL